MAHYDSFDKFIEVQAEKYKKDGREIGSYATSWNGKGRDIVGSEAQWMQDNIGLLFGPQPYSEEVQEAVDNLNDFFSNVGSGEVEDDYFGNYHWYDHNTDKFGNTEFSAYGYLIMNVNDALRSGQISADQYRETMTTVFSDEFMDNVRAGKFDQFDLQTNKFEAMRDKQHEGQFDDYEKSAHHDVRNVVNDMSDYLNDYGAMYHTNTTGGPDYFNQDGYDAMRDMLQQAKDSEQITDEQYDAIYLTIAKFDTSDMQYNVLQSFGATTLYAMHEALESNDPNLINQVFDSKNFENILSGDSDAVPVLRDLEQAMDFAKDDPMLGADVDHGDSVTPGDGDENESPGDGDENEGPGDGDDGHTIPDDVQDILNNLGVMDGATDTLSAITDDMIIRHFDDPDTGMSFETYQRMADVYDNIKDEHAKETYLAHNPVFADAVDYVNRVDAACYDMIDGFNDGTFDYKENGFFKDPELKEDVQESIQHMIDGDLYEMPDPEAENENDGAGHVDVDAGNQLKDSLDFETGKELATGIWAGKYGSGNERVEKLTALGYSEDDIKRAQSLVNQGYNFCVNMTEDQFNATMDAYDAKMAENDGQAKTLAKGVVDGATIRQEEAAAAEAEHQDDDASGTLSGAIADGTEAGTETSADDEMEFIPGPVFGGDCDNPENRETDDKEAEDVTGPDV